MVNPVNSGTSQVTLNPFQKRIDEQIKNPESKKDTQENAQAGANQPQQEERAVQSAAARNDNSNSRQNNGGQRGSLIDVTV